MSFHVLFCCYINNVLVSELNQRHLKETSFHRRRQRSGHLICQAFFSKFLQQQLKLKNREILVVSSDEQFSYF